MLERRLSFTAFLESSGMDWVEALRSGSISTAGKDTNFGATTRLVVLKHLKVMATLRCFEVTAAHTYQGV